MTDRLVIEITGTLPDKGKHAILAAAEVLADGLAIALRDEHDVDAAVSVRAVRPGKKSGAPAEPVVAKGNGAGESVRATASELAHG